MFIFSTLSSFNPVVGRKKSTRWVVRKEREDADYDEYDWYVSLILQVEKISCFCFLESYLSFSN